MGYNSRVDSILSAGTVHSINVSNGGVPKRPVLSAAVSRSGVEGDRQNDLRYHGGPDRAVSLYSLEIIERLRTEGHPIEPGSAGENLTLAGVDWRLVAPGARLEFDSGVVLEVVSYCVPCGKIRPSFADGRVHRINQEDHPGESRVYARVLAEGMLREGEGVRVCQPA
ncbi:MAG: MOSC domain-containing protein [Thermoanaerobaculia bacterium]|nr:hypothetical protein [Thermoanaerobaculia bacterium]MCK6683454.1 MOSC domain-containing protein [Thermoanaerobaculia bacterium]